MKEGLLTIGAVAKEAGVNIQTVRYYERRRLLIPSAHRDSGYRLYAAEAVRKLRFIKNAQELGFTLHEIAGLLKLQVSHRSRCADVKKKAEEKLADVHAKIMQLRALEKVLLDLIKTCRANAPTARCPILRTLELHENGVRKRTYEK